MFDPSFLAKSWNANLWLGLASWRFCRSYCGTLLRWIWHYTWTNDLIQRLPLFIQKFGVHVCLQSWLWNGRSENSMSEWEMENPDAKCTCVGQWSHVWLRCCLWIKEYCCHQYCKANTFFPLIYNRGESTQSCLRWSRIGACEFGSRKPST